MLGFFLTNLGAYGRVHRLEGCPQLAITAQRQRSLLGHKGGHVDHLQEFLVCKCLQRLAAQAKLNRTARQLATLWVVIGIQPFAVRGDYLLTARTSAIFGAESKMPAPRNEVLASLFTTLETVPATPFS
ncbi:hypothetical protein [Aquabacterium parvum]